MKKLIVKLKSTINEAPGSEYWAHRQTPIRVHPKVSHYHVSDKRRPNHFLGLTFCGPCGLTGYAQTG